MRTGRMICLCAFLLYALEKELCRNLTKSKINLVRRRNTGEEQKNNQFGDIEEKDGLRARFAGWLEVTVFRAKLKYLRKAEQGNCVIG